MKNIVCVHFSTDLNSRKEMINGEPYVVYPVIMMTEGVHAGSGGPTLYSANELENYHWTWNGVPVSVEHPQDNDGSPISCNDPQVYNTQVVGKIFNTIFEDGKLKAEAWLSESILNALGADVIQVLESGSNLEVSTGLFCDAEGLSGNWNGEEYESVATNIRPDHLALLPGGVGACSWKDGCGIRANKGEEKEMEKESIETQTLNNEEVKEEGMAKTMAECCPDKVTELISNNENFTEDDKDVLLGMTEDAFEMIINKAKPIETKEKVNDQEPENEDQDLNVNEQVEQEEETKMTFDELLANADPEVAESIRNGHRMFQESKNKLIQKVFAHEANSFTEDELKAFSFDHLEKLASFIPEKKGSNFVGNAGVHAPVVDNDDPTDGTLPDMDFDFTAKE